MPLLRWVASVARASLWLAVNLAIASALFLASAAMYAQASEDMRVPAGLVRAVAAFWLYLAAWTWLVRGVFMRPRPSPSGGKPTGGQVARGALGCIGNLAAVGLAWLAVGAAADWAWAGMNGQDPLHPARRVADQGLAWLRTATAQPDVYGPPLLAGLVGLAVLYAALGRLSAPAPQPSRQQAAAAGSSKRGRRARQGPASRPTAGASPAQIHTRAGDAIATAHGGEGAAKGRRQAREDAVIGPLRWSSADGGWWARQAGEAFPIHIEADADGPSVAQLDVARAVVQRAFEAQLRSSDVARSAAQKRGVGLPRFTIVRATVGREGGGSPPLVLHLRCEGDSQHEYSVRSTDALHSYELVPS